MRPNAVMNAFSHFMLTGGPVPFRHVQNETYWSNGTLASYMLSLGWDGVGFCDVAMNAPCAGSNISQGIRTGNFPMGLRLTINNYVYGKGGSGGGGNGGTAIWVECDAEIIGGSGCLLLGGGGGGDSTDMSTSNSGGGGGAGGGTGHNTGGVSGINGTAGGAGGQAKYQADPQNGGNGGYSWFGSRADAGYGGGDGMYYTYDGGNGFTYGSTGGAGGGGGYSARGGEAMNSYGSGGAGGIAMYVNAGVNLTLGGLFAGAPSGRFIGGITYG